LRETRDTRIALEAYPGLLARRLGVRSYKNDDRRKWTPARRAARKRMVDALCEGAALDIKLLLEKNLRASLIQDGTGDLLDAVLCAVQAHWGWLRAAGNYGLPAALDPLEGWIVSA
jgi:hypothetical protein